MKTRQYIHTVKKHSCLLRWWMGGLMTVAFGSVKGEGPNMLRSSDRDSATVHGAEATAGADTRDEPLVPEYDIGSPGEIVLDRVSARRVDRIDLRETSGVNSPGTALARSSRIIPAGELLQLPPPRRDSVVRSFEAYRGAYFDLWSVVEGLSEDRSDTAIGVEFRIRSGSRKVCFLGIGANEAVVVLNDGVPVFGVNGWRENIYTHHIVPLTLKPGTNRVEIVFQKEKLWESVPADHLTNEWAANLQLFGTEELARTSHRQRVAHPFDTPVVESLEDLRIDRYWETNRHVEVFDMDGNSVAVGGTRPNTSIEWQRISPDIQFPFIGIAMVKDDIGEPIVVYGPAGIESALRNLETRARGASGAWAFRLNHLIKQEFADDRDAPWTSWGRKLAITASKLFMMDGAKQLLRRCPSMAVEFGTYESSLDGTNQHYRYYRKPAVSGPRTLAVIVPTAPEIMRPYLELVADLQNTERTAGLADANGLDVLWPGGVSPDYGGRVARHEVREALRDYLRHFPPSAFDRVYLIGSCSAALATLGLISDGLAVDGAVLWSPVVHRYREAWARERPVYSREVPSVEQTDLDFEALKGCPMLLYWDCDAEGHGDKLGSVAFVERAKGIGCSIEAVWVTPAETKFLWGPREAVSIQAWMAWIKRAGPSPRHNPAALLSISADDTPVTVKNALLRGITLSPAAAAGSYGPVWTKALSVYRGATPVLHVGDENGRTIVDELHLSGEELIERLNGDHGLVPSLSSLGPLSELSGQPLWGFRLVANGPQSKVEILSTLDPNEKAPTIDLLVDGTCRAALWRRVRGLWRLVHVWQ